MDDDRDASGDVGRSTEADDSADERLDDRHDVGRGGGRSGRDGHEPIEERHFLRAGLAAVLAALSMLRDQLRIALAEHRWHVGAATGLFGLGVLGGVGLHLAGVNLLEVLGLSSPEELLPEDVELTTWFIFRNNARVLLLLVGGALTLGLLTVLGLVFNGVVIGWVVAVAAGEAGLGLTLALLVPHGVLELPAFWIAAGVAFRLLTRPVSYLLGRYDHVYTRAEAGRAALLVVVALLAVLLAAAIEVHVTPAIAEALFDLPEGSIL